MKRTRTITTTMAVAALSVVIMGVGAGAASADLSGCTTSQPLNTSQSSCRFALVCPGAFRCAFAVRLRVDGVGRVGGTMAITGRDGTLVTTNDRNGVLRDAPTATNNCAGLLGCSSYIGGSLLSLANPSLAPTVDVVCTETGPAALESLTCDGETRSPST